MHHTTHAEIATLIEGNQTFVLTTHVNPDGDGLGCEYALFHWLRAAGKTVRIINTSAMPDNYSFLGTEATFECYDAKRHDDFIANTDVIFVLDMNDARRLVRMEASVRASEATTIVIDHHLEPHEFATHYFVNDDACATGEMLFDLLTAMKPGAITKEIAFGIYIAIMTDTGSFRFPRTSPRIHRIVAELLEHGIDPSTTYQKIYDDYPVGRAKLIGAILASIEPIAEGKATLITVTQRLLAETATNETDIDNVVNYGLSIRGVRATALILELPDGVKVSLRSRGSLDVAAIARTMRGGGHRNAAGIRLFDRSMGEVTEKIRRELESAFELKLKRNEADDCL